MTQELRRLAEAEHNAMVFDRVSSGSKKYAELTKPAAILSLLDRLEKAEKDAERYRWLRDTGSNGFSDGVPQRGLTVATEGNVKLHFAYWMTAEQFDKTIDAAMEASK